MTVIERLKLDGQSQAVGSARVTIWQVSNLAEAPDSIDRWAVHQ